MSHKFLVHYIGDSVGVAIDDIAAGEEVLGVFLEDDSTILIHSNHQIPLGHKIALHDISENSRVIEYRVPIGVAMEAIKEGSYVHTHNLKTARW
ncbi:UxaA family hydrolase [Bacillus sp. USDA818B3_A]|uniref:UxaA family hydrolase n=1 Tax=Bacillus sp. USDA818B3_A TaxID=2698834 RepID=UPI0013720F1E|nr:UxaA family hydrolase [Bacillus sp. USDA818B3_A]